MANNETSLNENLIAAGLNTSNPQSTYVDFAEQIAKNQQEQASQEQAIALAKEHVKQAKFQTQYEAPDSMTPQEAAQYLKIVAQAKGLTIDQASIDAWVSKLPDHVNRQVVESFANRFARESTRSGQPFVASAADEQSTKRDENGDPLVEGQTYAAIYDNTGAVKNYLRSGQERPDGEAKAKAKSASETRKDWQKLDTVVNGAFKTRSGGLGSLSTAIFRAVRAINTINATKNITAQDLANIAQDVAGIFQGGSPTVVTARDNDYKVTLLQMADWFRAQTGTLVNIGHLFGDDHSPLDPTKRKLLQVCVDLRDSAINNLKSFIESEAPAYKEIIDGDPERWETFKAEKTKFIESGLLIPPYSESNPSVGASPLNITGMDHAAEAKNPKGKSADKSSGMKMPALDDIDAELAKRNSGKK